MPLLLWSESQAFRYISRPVNAGFCLHGTDCFRQKATRLRSGSSGYQPSQGLV